MTQIRLLEWHAREALRMGEDWHAHTFHAARNPADHVQLMYYRVVGCRCPLITRGPRTGRPNFRKHAKGTERTIYFTPADQEAWELAWEQRTGHCRACVGAGREPVKWSAVSGSEYRPCATCAGTGAAPLPLGGTP